jgi:hypothetical protein
LYIQSNRTLYVTTSFADSNWNAPVPVFGGIAWCFEFTQYSRVKEVAAASS